MLYLIYSSFTINRKNLNKINIYKILTQPFMGEQIQSSFLITGVLDWMIPRLNI